MAKELYKEMMYREVENIKNKAEDYNKKKHIDNIDEREIIMGRNIVIEALKNNRSINRILVSENSNDGSIKKILGIAKEKKIIISRISKVRLDNIADGENHQGVIAYVAPIPYVELDDIIGNVEFTQENKLLLLLDGLEDPHNFGALLRTAEAAGVHGVLLPKRHSVPLNHTVAKVSAGAVEYVPVARIGNISQTLKKLQRKGFWIIGAAAEGNYNYYDVDLKGNIVIVIGSEGYGLSRLTRELCDFIVKIPMIGNINSLNASVAGSLIMMEAMRQRFK